MIWMSIAAAACPAPISGAHLNTTLEEAEQKFIELDMAGFDAAMAQQRANDARGRGSHNTRIFAVLQRQAACNPSSWP